MASRRAQVLILGAGAAGLAAARFLRQRSIRVQVLEARDRIGGRIWTYRESFWPPLELGAEFVHGKHPLLWSEIRRAHLRTGNADGLHLLLERGRLRQAKQLFEQAAAIFVGAGDPEESIGRFVHRATRGNAPLRQLAMAFAEGFFASHPERTSAEFVGRMARASAERGGDEMSRVLDGYDSLAGALVQDLSPGSELWLNARVWRVRWSHHRVEAFAETERKSPLGPFAADRVVVTLPLGVLQAPAGRGGIAFEPRLGQKAEAFRRLEMGAIIKVLLRFRRAPWAYGRALSRSRQFAFAHAPSAPVPTWWRPLPFDEPLLVGWAGGRHADALSHHSSEWILERGLDSLVRIFGVRRAQVESLLESARVVDWQADPHSRGGYCVVPVGAVPLQEELARPVEDTLFFAGEATHATGFAGTVHGAMATGERAAREVLRGLGRR